MSTETLRLSGWCSPTDQYHKDCKSSTCECANDPANHGRNALFTRGLGVSVRYDKDGSDRDVSAPQPEPDPASLDYTEEQG